MDQREVGKAMARTEAAAGGRVVVAARSPIVREGMCVFVARAGMQAVGEITAAGQALAPVVALAPDVVLLESELAESGRFALLRGLKEVLPQALLIVANVCEKHQHLLQAVAHGAAAYVAAGSSPSDLLGILEAASNGRLLLVQGILRDAVDALDRNGATWRDANEELEAPLAPREVSVLTLMAQGAPDKHIAAALDLSESTVKVYVSNILHKLLLTNRVQAVLWALSHGLGRVPAVGEPIPQP